MEYIKLIDNPFYVEFEGDKSRLMDAIGVSLMEVVAGYRREYPDQVCPEVGLAEMAYRMAKGVREGEFHEKEEPYIFALAGYVIMKSKNIPIRRKECLDYVAKQIKNKWDRDISEKLYRAIMGLGD